MKISPIKSVMKTVVKPRTVVDNLSKTAPKGITKTPVRLLNSQKNDEHPFLWGIATATFYAATAWLWAYVATHYSERFHT